MQNKLKQVNYLHQKQATDFQMNLFGEQNQLLVTGQLLGRVMLQLGLLLCICHLFFNTIMMITYENDTFRSFNLVIEDEAIDQHGLNLSDFVNLPIFEVKLTDNTLLLDKI